MLAEDPAVPMDYRILLGSLRDDNEPMAASSFWQGVPPTVRSQVTHLGRCLGVGSVKQASVARGLDEGWMRVG